MRIAASPHTDEPVARALPPELRSRGHDVPVVGSPRNDADASGRDDEDRTGIAYLGGIERAATEGGAG